MNGGALELRGAFLAVLDALRDAGMPHAFIGAEEWGIADRLAP